MLFNKNIFQVWFQGIDNLTDLTFKQNVKNWKLLNPDWNYYCFNDSDLRKLCYIYSQQCGKAYDNAQYMHAKIDLGRFVCLYLKGGIMIDMDMYVLRSLNSLHNIDAFINTKEHIIGVSKMNLNFIESFIYSGKSESYNNAVILSTVNNPLIKIWIDQMVDNILNIKDPYTNSSIYISMTTGPNLFNKIFTKQNILLSKIIVYPNTIFEPCEPVGYCNIKKDSISIHKFELSWLPNELKILTQLYFKYIRPNSYFIITALILYYYYKSKTKK